MARLRFRVGLLGEILGMAVDTLRTNKLRSALTVLGVVIGVTSIVGMTSLIRGFGDQFESLIRQMGSDTIYVAKLSISSFASGRDFWDVMRRPDLTEEDAAAIKLGAPSARFVGMQLGGGPGSEGVRLSYRSQGTKSMQMIGVGSNYPETNYLEMAQGRFFNEYEVQRRRNVIVLGAAPAETLFPNTDPVGKKIRAGAEEFTVLGVLSKRPSLLGGNPDEFAVIPISTYDKIYDPPRIRGMLSRFLVISVVPYEGIPRSQLQAEVEQVIRSRHRLKVDQENDFDVLTSDVLMRIFDQFTQARVFGAGRDLVDRVDGGRHRRDGHHDDFGHRADARDRRAQGARRAASRDPVAVPARGGLPDLHRRRPGHRVRQRHRMAGPRAHRLPDLAAVVVVCPRDWIFGDDRDFVRDVARLQGLAARSNRRAALRVGRQTVTPNRCTSSSTSLRRNWNDGITKSSSCIRDAS